MNDWQQEWMKFWDAAAQDVERFWDDLAQGMTEALDAFIDFSDEIATHLDEAIAQSSDQLDEQVMEWVTPFVAWLNEFEETATEAVEPMNQTIYPLVNQHPICMGCRHYHGQIYGGTMLVCGMHPYGVSEGAEDCPDKERVGYNDTAS